MREISVSKVWLAFVCFGLVFSVSPSLAQQRSDADVLPLSRATAFENLKLAQLRGYSSAGTHQCGSEKRSCVVAGSGFENCNEALSALKTRDCCPTIPMGGKSNGFVLNYCIVDRPQ